MRFYLVVLVMLLSSSLMGQQLKVLTYNMHHANPPADPEKIDLEAIAQVIRNSGADIVGVQEVDIHVSRSHGVDQAKKLSELTGMDYFFSKGIDLEQGEYGTLILSKHKILQARRYDLPMPEPSENRSLAIVDIELPSGLQVSFANTHLDLKPNNRRAQAEFITELADLYTHPLILVGDLNARPDSEPIAILSKYFVRNTQTNGATSPNNPAKNEIDYIMLLKNSAFDWISYGPLTSEHTASDHLPVFAELLFSGNGQND